MSIKNKRQISFSKAISWRFTVPVSSVSYFCSTGDFFPKVANVAYVCAVHMAQHLCIIRFLFGCTELKSTLSLSLQLQAMAHQISCKFSQILSHYTKKMFLEFLLRNWPRRNLSVKFLSNLGLRCPIKKGNSKLYNFRFNKSTEKSLESFGNILGPVLFLDVCRSNPKNGSSLLGWDTKVSKNS